MIKKIISIATRLIQVLLYNKVTKFESKKRILFYPAFEKISDLENHVNRVRWYVPSNANCEVDIILSANIKIKPESLSIPKGQRKPINKKLVINFYSEKFLNSKLSDSYLICIWNTNSKWRKLFFKTLFKIRIVDPNYYKFTETHTYPGILWHDILSRKHKEQAKIQS